MQLSKVNKSNPFNRVSTWVKQTKDREALKNLSNHLLKDIGLTRTELRKEGINPLWKGQFELNKFSDKFLLFFYPTGAVQTYTEAN